MYSLSKQEYVPKSLPVSEMMLCRIWLVARLVGASPGIITKKSKKNNQHTRCRNTDIASDNGVVSKAPFPVFIVKKGYGVSVHNSCMQTLR